MDKLSIHVTAHLLLEELGLEPNEENLAKVTDRIEMQVRTHLNPPEPVEVEFTEDDKRFYDAATLVYFGMKARGIGDDPDAKDVGMKATYAAYEGDPEYAVELLNNYTKN